ncbi:MAG: GMC family oxidoreductase [Nitrospirae bacterium]|nr:GMC family oxidoreductase [Nitrospirota bacterium]
MTLKDEAILRALASALFPRGGTLPLGVEDLALGAITERLLSQFPPGMARQMGRFLRVCNLLPLFQKGRTFMSLSEAERAEYLSRAAQEGGTLSKNIVMALNLLCESMFLSDPRAQAGIGYDGAPMKARTREFPESPDLHCQVSPDLQPGDVECDVCVVGSGAGGAIVARELAEVGHKVIVLEEGGPARRSDFDGTDLLERVGRFYRGHGFTATFGSPVILLPMGCAVGGTTVVNSGTCFRTPEAVLHEWAEERGLQGVGPEDLARCFDRVEAELHVEPVGDEIMSRNGRVLRRGAEALGVKDHGPIRRPTRDCHGSGVCAFGCPTDAKQAMHLSYLPAAVRHGAAIFARCRAKRVLFEGNQAVGVEADILAPASKRVVGRLGVRAKSVVLAAGAIYTPFLLHKSGYHHALLGRGLKIHPGCGVAAMFDEEIYGWKGVMQCYYVHDLEEKGILLEATFPPPIVTYSAGTLPFVGIEHKELVARYRQMATLGVILSDRSEGRVAFTPWGPLMLYGMTAEDAKRMQEAIEWSARLYFAAGAKRVFTILPGLEDVRSPSDVPKITAGRVKPSQLKLSAYHPMGTCRMGAHPEEGVTDSAGRVWGVENLFVADASLLPDTPHVNPQITIMALATKVAFHLREVVRS